MTLPTNPLPEKRIIIVAGPNGAGKTTFAMEFLSEESDPPLFINADLLAAAMDPLRPERAAFRAGRMMLEIIDACVQRGESFSLETTLSGRGYARMIPRWQELGYWVQLIFLRCRRRKQPLLGLSSEWRWAATTYQRRTYAAGFMLVGAIWKIRTAR